MTKLKEIILSPITALIVLVFVSLWIDKLNETSLRTDPAYGVNLNGDTPQIVNQVKVNDDARPHIFQTWYNPVTKEYSYFIVEVK